MTLPWECVAFRFCVNLGLQGNQRAADEAYSTHRTDWLGNAITQLNDEGITTPTNVRQQATPYGWRESQA
jgi:hypothetical protein